MHQYTCNYIICEGPGMGRAIVTQLTLISHVLCPYVQRAVISLTEKRVPFERIDVDLSNKPQWFTAISPLGKTPVLRIGETAIFESAVILEYLEETQQIPLHPADPLRRAEHRAWIEFGSAVLNDIAGFYAAADAVLFDQKAQALVNKFERLEARLGAGPYFDNERFSLVDAVFGPVFRYFKPKVAAYRQALSVRPSVRAAVSSDYNTRLWGFLLARNSHLSHLMADAEGERAQSTAVQTRMRITAPRRSPVRAAPIHHSRKLKSGSDY
jgi:glutathione S-transferase